jgi:hypothetical protein
VTISTVGLIQVPSPAWPFLNAINGRLSIIACAAVLLQLDKLRNELRSCLSVAMNLRYVYISSGASNVQAAEF